MEFDYPERHPFGLGIPAPEFAGRLSRFERELRKTGELAADVWIQRPVIHPRRTGRVEHPLGGQRNEPGAAEALVEDDGRMG